MKPLEFTSAVVRLIDMALEEDIGPGDITTDHTVPSDSSGQGIIMAKGIWSSPVWLLPKRYLNAWIPASALNPDTQTGIWSPKVAR
jgi:hypothetical protein